MPAKIQIKYLAVNDEHDKLAVKWGGVPFTHRPGLIGFQTRFGFQTRYGFVASEQSLHQVAGHRYIPLQFVKAKDPSNE